MDMDQMVKEDGVPEALHDIKKTYIEQKSGDLNLAHLFGFGEEECDAAYAFACQKINVGDLDEATGLLLMLVLMRPKAAKYWRAIGLIMHRRKVWGVADLMYSRALGLDPDDVIARVFRAEVLLWMNRRGAARREAEHAISDAQRLSKREHAQYVQRAKAVMSSIKDDDGGAEFVR